MNCYYCNYEVNQIAQIPGQQILPFLNCKAPEVTDTGKSVGNIVHPISIQPFLCLRLSILSFFASQDFIGKGNLRTAYDLFGHSEMG